MPRRKKSLSSVVKNNVALPIRRSKRLQNKGPLHVSSKRLQNKIIDRKTQEQKFQNGHSSKNPPVVNEQGPSTSASTKTKTGQGKKVTSRQKNIKLVDDNQPNKVSSGSSNTQKKSRFDDLQVAERYLEQAEEYIEKAERFEKEAHVTMNEADTFSKKGEDLVEKALLEEGPLAIKLYESARNTYNAARMCLEESVRCNDAATRNYKTARDYYECYGRSCPGPTHPI